MVIHIRTVYSLSLLCFIALMYCGAVHIDVFPRNPVVFVGVEVTFQCHYNGSFDLPLWRINGKRYYLEDNLPQFHSSSITSLTVSEAQLYMNRWEYICFLPIVGRQNFAESSPVYLTVKNHTVHASSSVTSTTIMLSASEVVSSAVTTINVDVTQVTSYKSTSPKESFQVHETKRDGQQSTLYIAIGAGVTSAVVFILVIIILSCAIILVVLRSLQLPSQEQSRVTEKETDPIYEHVQDSPDNHKDGDPEPVYDEVLKRIHMTTVAHDTPHELPTSISMRDTGEDSDGTSLCTDSAIHLQHCPAYKVIGGRLQ